SRGAVVSSEPSAFSFQPSAVCCCSGSGEDFEQWGDFDRQTREEGGFEGLVFASLDGGDVLPGLPCQCAEPLGVGVDDPTVWHTKLFIQPGLEPQVSLVCRW